MDRQEVIDILVGVREENRIPNFRCAYLSGADLKGIDLSDANLMFADFTETNLIGACLMRANISEASFTDARIERANLRQANLSYTKFWGANLTDADLRGANLLAANLDYANLKNAKFDNANINEVKLEHSKNIPDYLAAVTLIVPEGKIIGWKKLRGNKIAKLSIPENACRSNATERKCRAEFVDVLEIWNEDDSVSEGTSIHYSSITYRVGERVYCDKWDENRWKGCSGGIHFFLTHYEAEQYKI